MTDSDRRRLVEIRRREALATSSEWWVYTDDEPRIGSPEENVFVLIGEQEDRICTVDRISGYVEQLANAEFIAHSRQDVPFLLDLIEQLTGERP